MKRCAALIFLNLCLIFAMVLPTSSKAASRGWSAEGSKWYYHDENGKVMTGWVLDGDSWYYLDPQTKAMCTGWRAVSGSWYFFGDSGKMRTGWQKIAGEWYYFGDSGRMRTGWQAVSGSWYYFGGSGVMRTGWQKISGEWYYFGDSGRMRTDWQEVTGYWYYFGDSGKMRTAWQKIGGYWYFFTAGGKMRTGWEKISEAWYYFSPGGKMQTGWQKISEVWYNFRESGAMLADGIFAISGKEYAFAADGHWRGEQSEVFFAAAKFMKEKQIVTDDMTKEEKLRACFDWLADKKNFSEMNPWIPHYKGVDWPQRYAGYFFEHTTGNCFSVNAAFAYMAKVIGYEEVYCCHDTGHGWAEVDDQVYDPEWARTHAGNWFARSYDEPDPEGMQNYKALRKKDIAWRYVAI